MPPKTLSRLVFAAFAIATAGIAVFAAGPWRAQELGNTLVTLSLVPLFCAFAIGPYVLSQRFTALASNTGESWLFIFVGVAAAIPALAIYIDAFLVDPSPDAQAGVIFVLVPAYQYAVIGAVRGGVVSWRRWRQKRAG